MSAHVSADKAMEEVFGAEYVSLHVRVSNKGAFHLYTETLGYK
jgi:peptide alpha-N-acetyltransferase